MYIAHRRESDGGAQTVAEHLRAVSCLAGAHAAKIGLIQAGKLIGLLHDLGKYSLAFQSYLKSAQGLIDPDGDDYVDAAALKGKIDHSTAGAQHVWQQLSARGGLGPYAAQMLALCIASHHSGLIDCISAEAQTFGEDLFTRRINKDREKTYLDEVVQAADPEIRSRALEALDNPYLLESVKSLVTRIVRVNERSPIGAQQQLGLAVRFLFSCLIDADRTDTADFEQRVTRSFRQHGSYEQWRVLADRLERHLEGLRSNRPIDALRREISQHCLDAADRDKGVFTLSVPTGGGKTLASLRFALQHARQRKLDRVIYILPFTSIIDQNAEVARQILEANPEDRGRIVLEHHSNLTPEQQSWREKILCESWDAPVVFTTMMQFLEALFGSGTRGARRMHQLANSVLIFDEVQTLPIKCVHLFNNAINFLAEQCNTTAVFCTATQPLLNAVSPEKGTVRLSPNCEMMPDRQKLFDELKRVVVKDGRRPGGWSYAEIASLAVDEMKREGSALVIVNTKEGARQVYRALAELREDERVHLSTDMCPAHRKQKLAYVRRRLSGGLPVLCVSTQLIEAGVDVDFRVVVRLLAGLDSIAQAAGRCNRNGRPEPGLVHVVNPAEENLGKLPDIKIGRDIAQRLLDDFREKPDRYRHNLFGPEALQDYYRFYFFERRDEMGYRVTAEQIGQDDTLLNLLSKNSNAVDDYRRKKGANPSTHLLQAFMTASNAFEAIDAPTRGVIVPFGEEGRRLIGELCAAYEVEKQYRLLKRAQQFTVNVFPNVLLKLADIDAVHSIQPDVGILHLDERYYNTEYGLETEPIQPMEISIV